MTKEAQPNGPIPVTITQHIYPRVCQDYNNIMTTAFFSHDDCAKHDMGADHPESPERLSRIISYIHDTGLADQLDWVRPEEATRDQLLLVHPEKYRHQLDLMQPAKFGRASCRERVRPARRGCDGK